MGSMVFTVMSGLAQMELDIKRERITDSVAKRRTAGKNLGGRPQKVTDRQIKNAISLIIGGEAAAGALRDRGLSRSTLLMVWFRPSSSRGVFYAPRTGPGGVWVYSATMRALC
jgi:DNA invertase Pin-like site-specific DNA recombinase